MSKPVRTREFKRTMLRIARELRVLHGRCDDRFSQVTRKRLLDAAGACELAARESGAWTPDDEPAGTAAVQSA